VTQLGRVLLDNLHLLHHHQRQERDAAGALRDPELRQLIGARDAVSGNNKRDERKSSRTLSHLFRILSISAWLRASD